MSGRIFTTTLFAMLLCLSGVRDGRCDENLTAQQGKAALQKAVRFFRDKVSGNGGYLWQYAGDLSEREGEQQASAMQVWVQPPGTPYVGEALLEAYLVCGEKHLLDAARYAAHALAMGQLASGGWDYRIEFDPKKRDAWDYRVDMQASGRAANPKAKNVTTLDDDTTQAALRFLMKVDSVLEQKDRRIHSTVEYALSALLKAQYPNGAWAQRFSEFPNPKEFPLKKASYPQSWPKEHPNVDYRSFYTFNDDTLADLIDTMFLAEQIYNEPRYGAAARKAGDFILLAQMPEPQPAWAQQYNVEMHPVWARRFEPTAVTGGESQGVIRILLTLYQHTHDDRYLAPIPKALDYLERSQLPNGQLARFYELKTNRPLYFTKDYVLTYDDSDMPTHYGFKVSSNVARLREDYRTSRKSPPGEGSIWTTLRSPPKPNSSLARDTAKLIAAMDSRGAWLEDGQLSAKGNDDRSRSIITTKTFTRNVRTLSRFVGSMNRQAM
ncbi:MAG: pectic acid lyase [Planctomycetota bacterium]|nr:pectic acid lyase [Planctomycetota bacterium]